MTAPVTAGLPPTLDTVLRHAARRPPVLGAAGEAIAPLRPVLDAAGMPPGPVHDVVSRLTMPLWPGLDPLLRPLLNTIVEVTGSLRSLLREAVWRTPLWIARVAGFAPSPVLSPGGEAYDGGAAATCRLGPPGHRAAAAAAGMTSGPALAGRGRGRAHAGPARTRRPPSWPGGPTRDGPAPAAGDGPAQQQTSAADVTCGALHLPEPHDTAPRAALPIPRTAGGKPSVSPD